MRKRILSGGWILLIELGSGSLALIRKPPLICLQITLISSQKSKRLSLIKKTLIGRSFSVIGSKERGGYWLKRLVAAFFCLNSEGDCY